MYAETAKPVLRSVWNRLKEVSSRVPREDQYQMYLARLKFDVLHLGRRHVEAVEAGTRLLNNKACQAEVSQVDDGSNCFTDVYTHVLVEAFRAQNASAAQAIFVRHAPKDPRLSKYTSHYQFPTSYLPRKRPSKPFWSSSEVPLARTLEEHAKEILAELQKVRTPDGGFRSVKVSAYQARKDKDGFNVNAVSLCSPWLRTTSPQCWQEFNVYVSEDTSGVWSNERCALTPLTCRILQQPEVIGRLNKHKHAPSHDGVAGKAGFIRLLPNKTIVPHTGPHNGRLTIHLGLKIPKDSYVMVKDERRHWEEGKALILDDSFVHHVANKNPEEDRIIFLVHVWHPHLVEELGYEKLEAAKWRAINAGEL